MPRSGERRAPTDSAERASEPASPTGCRFSEAKDVQGAPSGRWTDGPQNGATPAGHTPGEGRVPRIHGELPQCRKETKQCKKGRRAEQTSLQRGHTTSQQAPGRLLLLAVSQVSASQGNACGNHKETRPLLPWGPALQGQMGGQWPLRAAGPQVTRVATQSTAWQFHTTQRLTPRYAPKRISTNIQADV